VYIPIVVLSLIITMAAYCAFPLIFAKTRKHTITKIKYNLICYAFNFLIMVLFVAINGKSSGTPYLLWTFVFSLWGERSLQKRDILKAGRPAKGIKNRVTPSDEANGTESVCIEGNTMAGAGPEETKNVQCGTYSLSYANETPEQYGTWDIMGSDLKLEKHDTAEAVEPSTEPGSQNQEIPVVTKAVEQRTYYIKYCSKCGNGIDPVTKVCSGCGKQYFKGVPWKTFAGVVAIVLLAASVGLNVYMHLKHAKAQETIAELTKKNTNLKVVIYDLEKENEQYYDYWVDTFDKMDVFDSWIVFIENDGTNLYHKYDCNKFVFKDSWAHNIEYAEYIGYKPCPRCYD
jgi:hypothetical protein